jgi:hypothetical protein
MNTASKTKLPMRRMTLFLPCIPHSLLPIYPGTHLPIMNLFVAVLQDVRNRCSESLLFNQVQEDSRRETSAETEIWTQKNQLRGWLVCGGRRMRATL